MWLERRGVSGRDGNEGRGRRGIDCGQLGRHGKVGSSQWRVPSRAVTVSGGSVLKKDQLGSEWYLKRGRSSKSMSENWFDVESSEPTEQVDYRSERGGWVQADSPASLDGHAIIQEGEHMMNNFDGVRMVNTHVHTPRKCHGKTLRLTSKTFC